MLEVSGLYPVLPQLGDNGSARGATSVKPYRQLIITTPEPAFVSSLLVSCR